MTDRDAELEAAGILTVTTEADGTVTYVLTREGQAIGRQLAMTQGEDARLTVLNDLLDGPDGDVAWSLRTGTGAALSYPMRTTHSGCSTRCSGSSIAGKGEP